MVSIHKRGKYYYAGWTNAEGKWKEKSLETTNFKQARAKAAAIKITIEKRRGQEDRLTVLIESYRDDMDRRGLKAHHIKQSIDEITSLIEEIGIQTLEGLTTRNCEVALGYTRHFKRRTQNVYRASMSAFCNWLIRCGFIDINPIKNIPPTKVNDRTIRRELTDDELNRLFASAPIHRSLVYKIASHTGLRRGELETLKSDCVSWDKGTVFVRHQKAKSGKSRTVPVPSFILKEWKAWVKSSKADRIIPILPGSRTFLKDLTVADIPLETSEGEAVFHSLRGTYATNLFRAGVSPAIVQRLMGHANIQTTMRHYAKFNAQDSFNAVDMFEAFMTDKTSKKKRKRGSA